MFLTKIILKLFYVLSIIYFEYKQIKIYFYIQCICNLFLITYKNLNKLSKIFKLKKKLYYIL